MTVRFFTPFYTNNANYPFPYPINSIVKNFVNFGEFVVSDPISSTFEIFSFCPRPISYEEFFGDYSLQSDDSLQITKSTRSTLEKIAQLACLFIFYAALQIDRNLIRAGIVISALLLPKIYNRFSLPYFSPKIYFQAEPLMEKVKGKIFADKDENPNTLLALYAHYLHNNLHEDAQNVIKSIKPNHKWGLMIMTRALLLQIEYHLQNDNYTEAQKITDSLQKNELEEEAKILWVQNAISKNRQEAKELSDLILTNPDSAPTLIIDVQLQWVKFYLKNNNPDEAQKWLEAMSDNLGFFQQMIASHFQPMGVLQLYRFYLDTNNQGKAEEIEKSYSQDSEWNRLIKFEKIKYYLSKNNLEKAKDLYHSFESKCRWIVDIQLEFVLYYIQSKNLIEARKIFETMDFSHRSCLEQSIIFGTPLHTECKAKIRIANALLKI